MSSLNAFASMLSLLTPDPPLNDSWGGRCAAGRQHSVDHTIVSCPRHWNGSHLHILFSSPIISALWPNTGKGAEPAANEDAMRREIHAWVRDLRRSGLLEAIKDTEDTAQQRMTSERNEIRAGKQTKENKNTHRNQQTATMMFRLSLDNPLAVVKASSGSSQDANEAPRGVVSSASAHFCALQGDGGGSDMRSEGPPQHRADHHESFPTAPQQMCVVHLKPLMWPLQGEDDNGGDTAAAAAATASITSMRQKLEYAALRRIEDLTEKGFAAAVVIVTLRDPRKSISTGLKSKTWPRRGNSADGGKGQRTAAAPAQPSSAVAPRKQQPQPQQKDGQTAAVSQPKSQKEDPANRRTKQKAVTKAKQLLGWDQQPPPLPGLASRRDRILALSTSAKHPFPLLVPASLVSSSCASALQTKCCCCCDADMRPPRMMMRLHQTPVMVPADRHLLGSWRRSVDAAVGCGHKASTRCPRCCLLLYYPSDCGEDGGGTTPLFVVTDEFLRRSVFFQAWCAPQDFDASFTPVLPLMANAASAVAHMGSHTKRRRYEDGTATTTSGSFDASEGAKPLGTGTVDETGGHAAEAPKKTEGSSRLNQEVFSGITQEDLLSLLAPSWLAADRGSMEPKSSSLTRGAAQHLSAVLRDGFELEALWHSVRSRGCGGSAADTTAGMEASTTAAAAAELKMTTTGAADDRLRRLRHPSTPPPPLLLAHVLAAKTAALKRSGGRQHNTLAAFHVVPPPGLSALLLSSSEVPPRGATEVLDAALDSTTGSSFHDHHAASPAADAQHLNFNDGDLSLYDKANHADLEPEKFNELLAVDCLVSDSFAAWLNAQSLGVINSNIPEEQWAPPVWCASAAVERALAQADWGVMTPSEAQSGMASFLGVSVDDAAAVIHGLAAMDARAAAPPPPADATAGAQAQAISHQQEHRAPSGRHTERVNSAEDVTAAPGGASQRGSLPNVPSNRRMLKSLNAGSRALQHLLFTLDLSMAMWKKQKKEKTHGYGPTRSKAAAESS